jgi:hypothetical protein
MTRRLRTTSIAVVLALVYLAACSSAEPAFNPTAPLPPATRLLPALATEAAPIPQRTFAVVETLRPEETVGESMKPVPESPYTANLVQQAQQDLAKRLNIPVESIEFLNFEDVVWPDGGLGCPQPGMAYTQVMVEGYRIQLRYDGQVYNYHGGGGRPPFLCQNPQK